MNVFLNFQKDADVVTRSLSRGSSIAFAFTGFAVQIKAVPGQFAEAETLLSSALL